MKSFFLLCLFFLILTFASAQHTYLDSLKQRLSHSNNEDTARVSALFSLADYYGFLQFDSCLFYAAQTSELSKKLNYPFGKFQGYFATFHGLNCQANYPMALEAALNALKTAEELKNDKPGVMAQAYYLIGLLYREMEDYPNAISQFRKDIQLQEKIGEPMPEIFAAFSQLGTIYAKMKQSDSALWYAQKGYDLGLQTRYKLYFPLAIGALGNVYVVLGRYKLAEKYFRDAIEESRIYNNIYFQVMNYNNLASLFEKMNLTDSCIYYAMLSLQLCHEQNFVEFTFNASKILSKVYESEGKPDSTIKYMNIMIAAKDSVFSQSKGRQFQQTAFKDIQRQQEINTAKERYQNQVRIYALLASLSIFLLLTFILYRNTRQKQKAKIKIEKAYEELKSTQAQLIQSEKMASLGELTAGIAHEIQNPLNFVNNFSEVNKELIDEASTANEAGNPNEVQELLSILKDNEEKINHHGKRADAIVKGMLQHSRISTGVKEPTEINKLADEYLRLSYHGLRAKDKDFNAEMKTDFDESIGKINIIPQDIGRVLLNLYNNAFYAVSEKKKQQPKEYEPTVSVSSKKIGDKIILTVKDNGNGIPQKVIDKIFQPFFTTKPTGVGTGLGLSLSYDIIKVHGGEIRVNTIEGEFTEFVIQLPVSA
jgi:two-component system, NtrC family, sensor kinase